jgi:hypothetical protein
MQIERVQGGTANNPNAMEAHTSRATPSPADMVSPVSGMPLRAHGMQAETAAWFSIEDSTDPQDFAEFLAAFAEARFVFDAPISLR